ncbi:arylesterase [Alteraurantiacibacter aquimixticola]|uniref:Arylesterase n=1 Tax=Alteraurantiacibacter aquimixticola TaxID=2489173 RepID=A0A4T3F3T2_9SPHN|nr:arylesterase [Alteraurantiacibacter aquimixticola]
MYRSALRGSLAVSLALALAACGAEAPVAEAEASEPAPIDEELPVIGEQRTILAFGDSLFAGYDLAEDEGYPERLQAVLRVRGINARVIDAAVSGNTTAAGLQRISFVLDNLEETPDLAMVELGGNDLLRGITPDQTRENLAAILTALAERDIPVLLMGMRAPPNMGVQYQEEFDGLYPILAEEFDTALVPFFLEPVFDKPELILPDRIHPTAEGIEEIVAATVDQVVAALPEGD